MLQIRDYRITEKSILERTSGDHLVQLSPESRDSDSYPGPHGAKSQIFSVRECAVSLVNLFLNLLAFSVKNFFYLVHIACCAVTVHPKLF